MSGLFDCGGRESSTLSLERARLCLDRRQSEYPFSPMREVAYSLPAAGASTPSPTAVGEGWDEGTQCAAAYQRPKHPEQGPERAIERPVQGAYNHIVRISELGEFGLIGLVRGWTSSQPASEDLVLGIGDDAAAWRAGPEVLLGTTDTLVEGVHFLPDCSPEDLGWKAMTSNLSDIAAMGGVPRIALVSLALPATTEVNWLQALYGGMLAACREYNVALAGGDTVAASQVVLTIALVGRAASAEGIMRRSGARPGDLLALTGYLGNAEGGLRILKGTGQASGELASFLLEAHLRPRPRVAEGQALASLGVRAAIDISDGLLADCGHLCRESGVSATLRAAQLPVHPYLRQAFPTDYFQMAASGGEDYEILFAAPERLIERANEELLSPITVIGRVEDGQPGRVTILDEDERPVDLPEAGWEHFRAGS